MIDLTYLNEVIVDEYQDYSLRFHSLVEGVLRIAKSPRLFVVGDDWQAINRYNGSDPGYILEWESSELILPVNNRSLPPIVALANKLMEGRGPAAEAYPSSAEATVYRMKFEDLKTSALERDAVSKFTDLNPDVAIAILRLAVANLRRGKSVAILARTNYDLDLPKVKGQSRSQARPGKLKKLIKECAGTVSGHLEVETVHAFKGQQADVVILLADRFPLIHPHRVITEVFGDTEEAVIADERRLLYVGITRAKSTLYLLTGIRPQTDAMEMKLTMPTGNWSDFPPVGVHMEESGNNLVTIQGFGVNKLRQQLKQAGFRGSGPPLWRWERIVDGALDPMKFLESLPAESWFPQEGLEDTVTAKVLDPQGNVLATSDFNSAENPGSLQPASDLDDLPF